METRAQASNDAVAVYGSFLLGQTEFALDVMALQEVVECPSVVVRMPLAPPHLLGVFDLRGSLIPIVDLRPLLNIEARHDSSRGKVAIVELGDMHVGLLFDATGEILRCTPEQTFSFSVQDDTHAVIRGALKLDEGERILQILSPAAVLGLPDIPRPSNQMARRGARQGKKHQAVSFRVADLRLALPISAIQEIIRVPALNPSPLADRTCIGMLNLRGHTVPVVDFARFLQLGCNDDTRATYEASDERRIITLRHEDALIGLLVDEVCSIVGYRDHELLPMPAFARRETPLFNSCLDVQGMEKVIMLDSAALLANSWFADAIATHRDLYRRASSESAHGAKRISRETYVIFRIGQPLAVRIRQLREIIDYPADIMKTPGAPSFVLGVVEMRRELVTLVDVRSMYGMAPYEDITQSKVMLAEHRGEKYGLVVDDVENIVTIDGAARIPVPSILTQRAGNGLGESIREGVELPGTGTLMLVDVELICARLAREETGVVPAIESEM